MSRLFIGTFLSPENQAALKQIIERNKGLSTKWQCKLRWVKAEKLHLTWLFLGQIDEEKQTELTNKVGQVIKDFGSLSITYDQIQIWYKKKLPQLIALTTSEANSTVLAFAQKMHQSLKSFVPPFTPHITLARIDKLEEVTPTLVFPTMGDTANIEYGEIEGMAEFMPITQSIKTISLIESKQNKNEHEYHVLQTWKM